MRFSEIGLDNTLLKEHPMNIRTAKKLLAPYPLTTQDAARLVLEACEELGYGTDNLNHDALMCLLRRVMREGVQVIKRAEETVTFAEAVRQSLEARSGLRPTSRRNLRHYTNRMLRIEGVAERPLRSMTVKECRAILAAAFANSPSSYHKGRSVLHSVFAYGVRQEWCDRNPVDAIEAPRLKECPVEPLSLEEVERLERTAERPEHRAMQFSLKLLLYCGVRPTEVARIDPQRDIIGKELIIRSHTSKTGGGRVVPLRRNIYAFIRRHRERVLIPQHWEERWRALRRAARFPHWRADACRHTFASYHAQCFRDIAALQTEMGHSSTQLLRSRYISPVSQKTAKQFWA